MVSNRIEAWNSLRQFIRATRPAYVLQYGMSTGALIVADELSQLNFGHFTCVTAPTRSSSLYRESLVREGFSDRVTIWETAGSSLTSDMENVLGAIKPEGFREALVDLELIVIDEALSDSFPFDLCKAGSFLFEHISLSTYVWVFTRDSNIAEPDMWASFCSLEEEATAQNETVRIFRRV